MGLSERMENTVPWIEAELSRREIEPGVYDLEGAPEAVVLAWEREFGGEARV